jgi:ABC-type tungstate transport system substrate-binding protein
MDEPVLKDIWQADVPAADPRFVLAVMARAEQRRFRRELATTIGLAALAAVLLALVMPAMEFTWRESLSPYFGNLAILGTLVAVTLLLPQLLSTRD